MKYTFRLLYLIPFLITLQSCLKTEKKPGPIIDHFGYSSKYNWQEDSIQTGNNSWVKVEKGHVFSWLSQDNTLKKSNFGVYSDRGNIKADFVYTIQKDSIFAIKLSNDSVYFFGSDNKQRTDLTGRLSFTPDTVLVLQNKGLTPTISLKYKLAK